MIDLLNHAQANTLCRRINALWRMRGEGGVIVHRSETGFVITSDNVTLGPTIPTQPTLPEVFEADPEILQFIHLARPFDGFNSVGTGSDWSGEWPSTGPWGTIGEPVQEDELYRVLIKFPHATEISRVTLYFLEPFGESDPIFQGAVYSTDKTFALHDATTGDPALNPGFIPLGTFRPTDDADNYDLWRNEYQDLGFQYLFQMYCAPADDGLAPFAELDDLYGFDYSGPWVFSDPATLAFKRTNPLAIWAGTDAPFYRESTAAIDATRINSTELASVIRVPANTATPFWISINSTAQQPSSLDGLHQVTLPDPASDTSRVLLVIDGINQETAQAIKVTAKISLEPYTESQTGGYAITEVT